MLLTCYLCSFSADRLQLPMEALCVSLSLFSTQIRKTHRWLWVNYIIFQSGHACIQIILEYDLSLSGHLIFEMQQKVTREAQIFQTHMQILTEFLYEVLQSLSYLLFYIQHRSPRFAVPGLTSILLLEKSKNSLNGKVLHILTQPLSL